MPFHIWSKVGASSVAAAPTFDKMWNARDVPGRADALGLGWVYMKPKDGRPGIIQKTGGAGGFITYMAMVPEKMPASCIESPSART